jgi:AraC-like DNA-binding protein
MAAADDLEIQADGFDVVHARILRDFPQLVTELGGDPDRLMAQAGVRDGGAGMTYRQLIILMELAATKLGCPDFGMRLAKLQGGEGIFGPLGQVMKNSRTFGDALEYVRQHTYAHSLAARVWQRRDSSCGEIFSGHDILIDGVPNKCQAMEQLMLAGHLAAMELTGGHGRVRRVYFRHQPVSPPETYRRYFGCEVRFGQHADGVIFFQQDLECPILGPDVQALAEVTAFIDRRFTRHRPPLHADVRGVIMQLLATGACSNERVADELNLHTRTLHRHLRSGGTSFQQIKDEVRRDLMLYYLVETNSDFAWISERLGFAEQSVMTRRCNRWFGMSPTGVRARRLGTASGYGPT